MTTSPVNPGFNRIGSKRLQPLCPVLVTPGVEPAMTDALSRNSSPRLSLRRLTAAALLALAVTLGARPETCAQGETAPPPQPGPRLFGAEFEFAGRGNRIERWESQTFENHRRVMEVIVRRYGGNPADIRKIEWTVPHPSGNGERKMFRAEWQDPRGRSWRIEPEYVDSRGLDGYELVTPPLTDARESRAILEDLRRSGLVREGVKSGAHLHVDARDLIRRGGDATALINAINMHERFEPLLRNLFNPVRGSGLFNKDRAESTTNRFARSLALDHPELLRELNRLPEGQRTKANIEAIFQRHTAAEMRAHGINELSASSWKQMWKYRSLNLINILNINEALPARKGTIEFRMMDLPLDRPLSHELQTKLYRALVTRSLQLAERGEVIRWEAPSRTAPAGSDPVRGRGPATAAEARAEIRGMIEFLGLDPAPFEPLIRENVARTEVLPSEQRLRERLEALRTGEPVVINGEAARSTLRVELDARRSAGLVEPVSRTARGEWANLTEAERTERLRRAASEGRLGEFRPRQGTGLATLEAGSNNRIQLRSSAFTTLDAASEAMRNLQQRTGADARAFRMEVEARLGRETLRTQSATLSEMLNRVNTLSRLDAIGQGRSGGTLFEVAELERLRRVLETGEGRMTGRGRLGVLSAGGDRLRIELPPEANAETLRTRAAVMLDGLANGRTGPWTGLGLAAPGANNGRVGAELASRTANYFSEIEGRELSPERRALIERLGRRVGGEVLLPMSGFGNAPWLEARVARDLRFRAQEHAREVASIAERVAEGRLTEAGAERELRQRVERWARETNISRHTLRSLFPEATPASDAVFRATMSESDLRRVFESIRGTAAERAGDRGDARSQSLAELYRRLELRITESGQLRLDARTGVLELPRTVIDRIHELSLERPPTERGAFRQKALGLLLAEAMAPRIRGQRSARAREILEVVRGSRAVYELNGRTLSGEARTLDPVLERLARDARLGSRAADAHRARRAELSRSGIPGVDRFARWRRADGTINWSRMTRDGGLKAGAGVAHFALALFLKEMAVVVQTGDRARIEEFFDGLMTTDFFTTYALFSSGAAGANFAYSRYLERYIKPRFVSNVLRTNLVLATGMALPEIVHGNFNGKAFAIDVAALGLSSVAVKSGLQGISWVVNLRKADQAGRLARAAAGMRRFAKVGGWFYTAAETAVVLYLGDEISQAVNAWLDERAARAAMGESTADFFRAVNDGALDEEGFQEALDRFSGAHVNWRNYLYRPLEQDEQVYMGRLQRAAERAQQLAARREETLARLDELPALRDRAIRQYGSVEAYAEHLADQDEAELDRDVQTYMQSYNASRERHLREVYEDGRRDEAYLADPSLAWVASGARPGAAGDPTHGREDAWARRTRRRLAEDFADEAGGLSENRIQAYDDEVRALTLARDAVSDPRRRALLDERIALIRRLQEADRRLVTEHVSSEGAAGALRDSGAR